MQNDLKPLEPVIARFFNKVPKDWKTYIYFNPTNRCYELKEDSDLDKSWKTANPYKFTTPTSLLTIILFAYNTGFHSTKGN